MSFFSVIKNIKMINIFKILIILCSPFLLLGSEVKKQHISKQISVNYRSGTNLIYDCKHKSYACVNIESYEYCSQQRDLEIKEKKSLFLSCAPLKKFESFNECIKDQYYLQHRRRNLSFCRLDL